MKNTVKLLGIIAFAVIIGFLFAACGDADDTKDSLDGTTWKTTATSGDMVAVITFNSPNFTQTFTLDGEIIHTTNGTYTISGSTVTFTIDGNRFQEHCLEIRFH